MNLLVLLRSFLAWRNLNVEVLIDAVLERFARQHRPIDLNQLLFKYLHLLECCTILFWFRFFDYLQHSFVLHPIESELLIVLDNEVKRVENAKCLSEALKHIVDLEILEEL